MLVMLPASQALRTRKVCTWEASELHSGVPSITMLSQAEVFKERGSSWQGNPRGLPDPLCLKYLSTQVSKTGCAMLNTGIRNPLLCLPEQWCAVPIVKCVVVL